MGINIASSRATVGTEGKTLREQLKDNGAQLVDEMCRRARPDRPAMSLIIASASDGRYYIQLCAGPFKTEEEAVGLFRDLAESQDDIVRESQAIQKRKDELDADQSYDN